MWFALKNLAIHFIVIACTKFKCYGILTAKKNYYFESRLTKKLGYIKMLWSKIRVPVCFFFTFINSVSLFFFLSGNSRSFIHVSISHSLKLVPSSLSRSLNHCPVPLAFSLVLHRSPFPSLSISVLF